MAEISVETSYYTGIVTAVRMKNSMYDLIIGNIKGATDPDLSMQPTQAVQTRSQATAVKGLTPLVTPIIDLGSEDVAKLQDEDETLHRALESARQTTHSSSWSTTFYIV